MGEIQNDLRVAARGFAQDSLSSVILLVIGFVVAVVVAVVAKIGFGVVFVASGGNLPPWAAYLPSIIGAAFMMAAVGSIARAVVALENGDDSRRRGWAAVPLGMLYFAVLAAAAQFLGPAIIVLGPVLSWVYVTAMLDVVSVDSPLGLAAPWVVLRQEPARAIAVMVVSVLLGLLVTVAPLPFPSVLLVPFLLLFVLQHAYQVYQSVVEIPVARLAREEVERAQAPKDERSLPSFLRSAGSADAPSEPVVPGSSVAAQPAWQQVVLGEHGEGTAGAWVGGPTDGLELEVDVTGLAVARIMVATGDGAWFDLVEATPGRWSAAMPQAAPWFVSVHGLAAGASVNWVARPWSEGSVAA